MTKATKLNNKITGQGFKGCFELAANNELPPQLSEMELNLVVRSNVNSPPSKDKTVKISVFRHYTQKKSTAMGILTGYPRTSSDAEQ
jgi:hypothetical protein